MGDKGRGIPSRCRCGEDVVLRTSKTIKNPGRLFYACRYGEENGRGHLFKWTDETMVEEMEDIIPKIDELERASLTLQKGLQALESEMETLAMETRSCEAVVCGFEKELRGLEKEIQGCKMELRGLKNILVCVVLMVLVYVFVC
ncbi:unnamed protein product [Arabidopsis lyrata]|nr:uncharacterized protein At4g04775 [Arabidopsis lyrata subsp. lyrata]XP_002893840.2 uncharacterized protein At4g04775 [Arabidopsis lyrata subsp. lyrata]CAH8254426.1 unnamed protein product [Arabidopsis lyrata]CAH8276916.1 unnamed protein product [Arabidopsis lyrata]|eukprot:XP_002863144.2 uncharacterized protein At4g04775 [Arabidopsis lyrata subsp. lyrata]